MWREWEKRRGRAKLSPNMSRSERGLKARQAMWGFAIVQVEMRAARLIA
jgi:hypothetical protein